MFGSLVDSLSLLEKSCVDFCEENYVVTPYIAEFFNTISNIFIILAGLLSLYRIKQNYPYRFSYGVISLPIYVVGVGIGSVLLHSTLVRVSQAVDELSMIFFSFHLCYYYFILLNGKKSMLGLVGFVFLLSSVSMVYLFIPSLYWVFLMFFILSYVTYMIIGIAAIMKIEDSKIRAKIRFWFVLSWLSFLTGFAFWLVDFGFCETVRPFQFHSVWHFTIAYHWYYCCLQADFLYFLFSKKPRWQVKIVENSVFSKFLPYLNISANKEKD